jgi:hypothetical protein
MRKMKVEEFLEAQGNAASLYVGLTVVLGILVFMIVACALSID